MVKVQTRQALALQMMSEKEPKEDLMINIISEAIVLEIEKKEEEPKKITFWNKEIEIPKVEIAKVNDKEDIQNKVIDNSTSPSNTDKITVEEVVKKNENKETTIGIDVSKWQGYIDWKKVKNSGIEFVMIRIGYRGSTEGKIYMDPYFEQNIKGALANGIQVGIYFFSFRII